MQMPKGKEETRGRDLPIWGCDRERKESFCVERWGDGLCLMGAWAKRPNSPNGIFQDLGGANAPNP